MSETTVIIERVKSHPYIVLGGVAAVILWLYMRNRSASAAATNSGGSSGGVYTVASDPNMVALQAAQIQASAATAQASIAAQAQTSAVQAQAQVQTAAINAAENVQTATIGASMFQTASNALTTNYQLQNSYAGSDVATSANPLANVTGPYVIGTGNEWLGPDQAEALGFQPHPAGNINIPVYSVTPGTPGTSGDGTGVINTANTQLEELFNNVLRAGQGIGPVQNTILTTPSTSGTAATATQVGTAHVDPVFMSWGNDGSLKSITDVTPGASNSFGFTGSFNPITQGSALTFG